uniref:Uncharacterized protein n=1 Tax=Anguilla anguilla TaxID=7936 RepID=A0A0E9PBK0_ANGAN
MYISLKIVSNLPNSINI